MSRYYARASTRASSFAKELEFQFFIYQNEGEYPIWLNRRRLYSVLHSLPGSTKWNSLICCFALIGIVMVSMNYASSKDISGILIDITYNVLYFLHTTVLLWNDWYRIKNHDRFRHPWTNWIGYVADAVSFAHYFKIVFLPKNYAFYVKLACYYIRLHRPIRFLLALTDHSLKGSIVGTLLKYMYFFTIIRVIATNVFIWIGEIEYIDNEHSADWLQDDPPDWLNSEGGRLFYKGYYDIHKLFILIGPDSHPRNDMSRILYMIITILGCLLLMGITIASLALIIGIYLRPEEIFRSRFRLIMNDMGESHVPTVLREKVETFYRIYWLKQKAVSVTQLLPIFPPSLPAIIYTNIYFKAQQKSRILRDLSYQFLSEVAKHMETIHYIPGDAIIKRNSVKSSIIYISYGDVEMLSAEDDETAILRFTRGTILNSCGGCTEVACTRSHVAIRAATFCTAHVLKAADLWRVAIKYGKTNGQAFIVHSSFEYHLDRVKRHYNKRVHPPTKYKSNILLLKRNLIELKEARGPDGELLLERTDVFLELADCYIMRNRADAALTDESDAICLRPTLPCILQPSSSLKLAWDILVAFTTLIVAFEHPYQLVYLKTITVEFRFFNYMVTLIYIFDIMVHLSTGAKIEEGIPITFKHTSSKQMRNGWFMLDVLSTVPLFEFVGEGRFAGINKLFKLPKMFRVLMHMEDLCVYQSHALRFMSYFLLYVLLCYLVAALQQGYWCFVFGYCVVKNISDPPFWIKEPLNDGPVEDRLKLSWYWSISMITFTSHKTAEFSRKMWHNQSFVMMVLEVCTVLHIMVEATYSATIMVTETMSDQYKTCIELVKNFLVKNNVDPMIRHRFISYLQLCWYTDKAYSITHKKSNILFDLPSHVYQDILAMQRSKYILCIPFMKFLNYAMLKNVSSHARLFYTSPNEILLNTGDINNEIYVLKQGFCEIVDPETKNVVSLITSKSHFGDVECLLRFPAFYTVRAVTHVQVFSISIKHLVEAFETPRFKDAINFAKQQQEYSSLQKPREQFLWYEIPPKPPNLERFPLPRKFETDYDFLHPFKQLGFFSILRYVFPRFTIRPDSTYLKRYEWFRAACAFLAANIYPLYSLLELQWPSFWHFGFCLDLVAYYDICQRMLVGYFDEKGILVYHPASTAAHYIRGAFIVDLLACIPLEVFDRKTNYFENNAYRYPASLQYFMYNRLLQLYRLPHALEILNDIIDRQDIIVIIKAFPLFMALLVLTTSLIMEYSVTKWSKVDGGWFLKINRDQVYGSWIEASENVVRYNISETPWNLVLTTYYWVIYETTTTGFNLFEPSRISILTTLSLGMLFGAMIITYFAVRVISIRSNVNQALASFQENIKDIMTFMKKENLDKELQHEVLSYYEYKWDKMGGTGFRTVLKLCDQITLRTDTILHIYGPTFTECPILQNHDLALLRIIGRAVHSMYFREKMTIIDRDDVTAELYFVDYGIIEARDKHDDGYVIDNLLRGSVFGNLENTKTIVCRNMFVAKSNVHLLKINAEIFYSIIHEFSSVKTLLKKLRPHNENFIISNMQDPSEVLSTGKDNMLAIAIGHQKIIKFLHNHSIAVQRYLIIVSMLCIYGDLYNAGFQDNSYVLLIMLYVLDGSFILKILMNYSQPLVTVEETISRVAKVARKKYYAGEFKYDVLSCLPIEILSLIASDQWTIFAFLRLNRLFRVVTVYNSLMRYQQKLFINLTLTTMSSVFIWFTLFVHTATCIWYLIGVYEDYYEPFTSWRCKDDGSSLCHNYVCAVYFVLTTFTQNGVGDILPKKRAEVAFVCILMILSTMIYMIYVGEFSNIIQFRYFRLFDFFNKYRELQEFLNNNRVSENLVTITKRYAQHLWQESRGLQIPKFLQDAPECLRLKIMSAAYMYHLTQHPVFKDCEPAFLRHLVGCLQPFIYNEDMYVVNEGEITDAMYFIHKGRVHEIDEETEEKTEEFVAGQHFGWENGIGRDIAFSYSYKTVIKSQILTLCFNDWNYLLKHFTKSNQTIFNNKSFGPRRRSSIPRVYFQNSKEFKIKLVDDIDTSTQIKPEPDSTFNEVTSFKSPSSDISVTPTSVRDNALIATTSNSALESKDPDDTKPLMETLLVVNEEPYDSTLWPLGHLSSFEKVESQDKLPFIVEDITHTEEDSTIKPLITKEVASQLQSSHELDHATATIELQDLSRTNNYSKQKAETIELPSSVIDLLEPGTSGRQTSTQNIVFPWPIKIRPPKPLLQIKEIPHLDKDSVENLQNATTSAIKNDDDKPSSQSLIHPITRLSEQTQMPALEFDPNNGGSLLENQLSEVTLKEVVSNMGEQQGSKSVENSSLEKILQEDKTLPVLETILNMSDKMEVVEESNKQLVIFNKSNIMEINKFEDKTLEKDIATEDKFSGIPSQLGVKSDITPTISAVIDTKDTESTDLLTRTDTNVPESAEYDSEKYYNIISDKKLERVAIKEDNNFSSSSSISVLSMDSDTVKSFEEFLMEQKENKGEIKKNIKTDGELLESTAIDKNRKPVHGHVHYEEIDKLGSTSGETLVGPAPAVSNLARLSLALGSQDILRRFSNEERPVQELTVAERNLHSLDSDVGSVMPATSETDNTTTSQTKSDSSYKDSEHPK